MANFRGSNSFRDKVNILLTLTASILKPVLASTKYRKASIFGKVVMSPILQCACMYSTYCTSFEGRYSSSSFINYPGTYYKVAVKKTFRISLYGFQNELNPSLMNWIWSQTVNKSYHFLHQKAKTSVLLNFFFVKILIYDT